MWKWCICLLKSVLNCSDSPSETAARSSLPDGAFASTCRASVTAFCSLLMLPKRQTASHVFTRMDGRHPVVVVGGRSNWPLPKNATSLPVTRRENVIASDTVDPEFPPLLSFLHTQLVHFNLFTSALEEQPPPSASVTRSLLFRRNGFRPSPGKIRSFTGVQERSGETRGASAVLWRRRRCRKCERQHSPARLLGQQSVRAALFARTLFLQWSSCWPLLSVANAGALLTRGSAEKKPFVRAGCLWREKTLHSSRLSLKRKKDSFPSMEIARRTPFL